MALAKTTSIKATSRASVKVRDNFYTVEYCEERVIPDALLPQELGEKEKVIAEERAELWDCVNAEVDNQVAEIVNSFAQKR